MPGLRSDQVKPTLTPSRELGPSRPRHPLQSFVMLPPALQGPGDRAPQQGDLAVDLGRADQDGLVYLSEMVSDLGPKAKGAMTRIDVPTLDEVSRAFVERPARVTGQADLHAAVVALDQRVFEARRKLTGPLVADGSKLTVAAIAAAAAASAGRFPFANAADGSVHPAFLLAWAVYDLVHAGIDGYQPHLSVSDDDRVVVKPFYGLQLLGDGAGTADGGVLRGLIQMMGPSLSGSVAGTQDGMGWYRTLSAVAECLRPGTAAALRGKTARQQLQLVLSMRPDGFIPETVLAEVDAAGRAGDAAGGSAGQAQAMSAEAWVRRVLPAGTQLKGNAKWEEAVKSMAKAVPAPLRGIEWEGTDLEQYLAVVAEAPENPLTPIDPKPRPRLADSPPESLSSRSPASVGQATGSGGPTRSRSVCP